MKVPIMYTVVHPSSVEYIRMPIEVLYIGQFCGKDCDNCICTHLFLASWKSMLDLSVHLFVPHNMEKKYEQPLVA